MNEHAANYAQRGLAVFPLHPIQPDGTCGCDQPRCQQPGKHPATSRWQNTIPSPKAARLIWRPLFNGERGIGLACGPRSGCFVLDVDPRHGGDETLAELITANEPLPLTWTAQTGTGGTHIYFKYPSDRRVMNSAGLLGPGLDIRGQGGYVVMPPSRHACGRRYEWVRPPGSVPLPQAPRWLLAKLTRLREPKPATEVGEKQVPGGQRHAALVSLLGLMRSWGASQPVLDAAAIAFVENQCLPDPERPLDLAHVHATAADIAHRYQPRVHD